VLERLVHQRGLEAGAIEGQPAQEGAAQRRADRGRQADFGVEVSQVLVDRRLLGDHGLAMLDGGHLAHGVDGQVLRLALLAFLQVEQVGVVIRVQLFQQHLHAH